MVIGTCIYIVCRSGQVTAVDPRPRIVYVTPEAPQRTRREDQVPFYEVFCIDLNYKKSVFVYKKNINYE